MKRLIRNTEATEWHLHQYIDDINRIKDICLDKGFSVSNEDVCWAWEKYSKEFYCASWLTLYEDDDLIFDSIANFLKEEK